MPTVVNHFTGGIPDTRFDQDGLGQSEITTLLFLNQTVLYMYRYESLNSNTQDRRFNVHCKGQNSLMVHLTITKWTMGESGCVTLTYRYCQSISDIFVPSETYANWMYWLTVVKGRSITCLIIYDLEKGALKEKQDKIMKILNTFKVFSIINVNDMVLLTWIKCH